MFTGQRVDESKKSSQRSFFFDQTETLITKKFENSLKKGLIDLLLDKEKTSILIKDRGGIAVAFREILSV